MQRVQASGAAAPPLVPPATAATAPGTPAVVRRNRWRAVEPATPFTPLLSTSVIVPAYDCARTLPFTLAALAYQDYPAHLLEVVVVDDGSTPPLSLPELRPERTRILRVSPPQWGRAAACQAGALASDGEVLLFLDADMLPHASHITAQLRWHHALSDAVTLGRKTFVPSWEQLPFARAVELAKQARLSEAYSESDTAPHWVDDITAATDQLHRADDTAFRVFTGSTGAMRRSLYDAAGGMDVVLRLGEDTELGYRLAQQGAVFIPVADSRSWHLGPPTVLVKGAESRRWNRPFLANRMALPRWLREGSARVWEVPLVRAVVQADVHDYETTACCVDRLLAGAEQDLQIDLVADWDRLHAERRSVLTDTRSDQYLLHERYRCEPRVRLVREAPSDVFPSPFRLDLPVTAGVGRLTVTRLLRAAQRRRLGLVGALVPGHGPDEAVRLVRTAAWHRARRHFGRAGDRELGEVWGLRWLDGAELGIVDLHDARQVAAQVPWIGNVVPLRRRVRKQSDQIRVLKNRIAHDGNG